MLAKLIEQTRELIQSLPVSQRYLTDPDVLREVKSAGFFTIKTGEKELVLMNAKCGDHLTFTLPYATVFQNVFKLFATREDALAAAKQAGEKPRDVEPDKPQQEQTTEPQKPVEPEKPVEPQKPKTLGERTEEAKTFDECHDLLVSVDSQVCKNGQCAPPTEARIATLKALLSKTAKLANNFWYATLGVWMVNEVSLVKAWLTEEERKQYSDMFTARANDPDWVKVSDEVAGKIKTRYAGFNW